MRYVSLILFTLLIAHNATAGGFPETQFRIEFRAPNPSYSVKIEKICIVDEEIWVIAKIDKRDVIAASVIVRLSDAVRVDAPDLPVKYFIYGKTWGWENSEPYTFLKDLSSIKEEIKSGRVIFLKEDGQ